MRTKQDKSLLKDFVNFLNSKQETTVSDIAKEINWNSASLLQYIYVIEKAGFIFRYGQDIILRKKIPPYSMEELKGLEKDNPDLLRERIDRLKETALTPKFLQSLTFMECLYLIRKFKTDTFTSKEFSSMTGKNQKSVGSFFTKLVRIGYLKKDKLSYTLIKDIPIEIQQSDFLKGLRTPKLEIAKRVEVQQENMKNQILVKPTNRDMAKSAAMKVDFLEPNEEKLYARAILAALEWGNSVK